MSELVMQRSLFGAEPDEGGAPALDFGAVGRHQLDRWSWIDEVPGWLAGADVIFDTLFDRVTWKSAERWMYDRMVSEPRLHGRVPRLDALDRCRAALEDHYGEPLDRGGVNLYRDGSDSVAWHGDRIRNRRRHALVATITLGGGRPFLVRPAGGGRSRRFCPRGGDLLVMGGACQRDWEHTLPKVRSASARISVTFRSRQAFRS